MNQSEPNYDQNEAAGGSKKQSETSINAKVSQSRNKLRTAVFTIGAGMLGWSVVDLIRDGATNVRHTFMVGCGIAIALLLMEIFSRKAVDR